MEKKLVRLLELETAVLECFLEKTHLSPLGVKEFLGINMKLPNIIQSFHYLRHMKIRHMKSNRGMNEAFIGGKRVMKQFIHQSNFTWLFLKILIFFISV
jgi:hypothetical protein